MTGSNGEAGRNYQRIAERMKTELGSMRMT
jgi:hypothetical protein